MVNRLLGLLLAAAISTVVFADTVALNPNHPDRYVVVKGDTLWDISARFLRDPWLWPEVWYVNPQIENPHLIYPGDVISLVYVDGQPQLRLQRGQRTIKLSPQVRREPLERAIPTIPVDAIKQFLTRPLVVEKDELANAPYIVESADEHLITGAGDRVYVRGIDGEAYRSYNVVRPGEPYVDPDTGEVLGYEALFLADAQVQRFGDPATLKVVRSEREAGIGDRLVPVIDEEIHTTFYPRAPEGDIDGRIISVVDGVSQIGQYAVVTINRGKREGLEPGHVLRIWQAGETIVDQVSGKKNDKVTLPDEDAGLLLVFRSFDKVSFGLVMEATRPIHVLDKVTKP